MSVIADYVKAKQAAQKAGLDTKPLKGDLQKKFTAFEDAYDAAMSKAESFRDGAKQLTDTASKYSSFLDDWTRVAGKDKDVEKATLIRTFNAQIMDIVSGCGDVSSASKATTASYEKAKAALGKAGINTGVLKGDFKKLVSAHAKTATELDKARTSVFADCEAAKDTVRQYMNVVGGWQKAISSDKARETAIAEFQASLTAVKKKLETSRIKLEKA